MSYRLFVFDIDGTLTDLRTMTLLDSSIQAVRELQAKGYIVAIDTGRGYNGSDIIYKKGLKPDYFIAACGHYIFDRDGNLIYEKELDEKLYERINEFVGKNRLGFFWKGDRYMISQYHHPLIDKIATDRSTLRFSAPEGQRPASGALITDRHGYEMFAAEFGKEVDIVDGGLELYDINQKGVSKASGMQELMKLLKIEKEETMAFGDSENDIEMLEDAGLGVAFEDSQDSVKEICDYLAPAAYEDGVYRSLKEMGVI